MPKPNATVDAATPTARPRAATRPTDASVFPTPANLWSTRPAVSPSLLSELSPRVRTSTSQLVVTVSAMHHHPGDLADRERDVVLSATGVGTQRLGPEAGGYLLADPGPFAAGRGAVREHRVSQVAAVDARQVVPGPAAGHPHRRVGTAQARARGDRCSRDDPGQPAALRKHRQRRSTHVALRWLGGPPQRLGQLATHHRAATLLDPACHLAQVTDPGHLRLNHDEAPAPQGAPHVRGRSPPPSAARTVRRRNAPAHRPGWGSGLSRRPRPTWRRSAARPSPTSRATRAAARTRRRRRRADSSRVRQVDELRQVPAALRLEALLGRQEGDDLGARTGFLRPIRGVGWLPCRAVGDRGDDRLR